MNNYQIVTYSVTDIRDLTVTPAGLKRYLKRRIKKQDKDIYIEVWEDDPTRSKGGQFAILFVDGEHKDAAILEEVKEYE